MWRSFLSIYINIFFFCCYCCCSGGVFVEDQKKGLRKIMLLQKGGVRCPSKATGLENPDDVSVQTYRAAPGEASTVCVSHYRLYFALSLFHTPFFIYVQFGRRESEESLFDKLYVFAFLARYQTYLSVYSSI